MVCVALIPDAEPVVAEQPDDRVLNYLAVFPGAHTSSAPDTTNGAPSAEIPESEPRRWDVRVYGLSTAGPTGTLIMVWKLSRVRECDANPPPNNTIMVPTAA